MNNEMISTIAKIIVIPISAWIDSLLWNWRGANVLHLPPIPFTGMLAVHILILATFYLVGAGLRAGWSRSDRQ